MSETKKPEAPQAAAATASTRATARGRSEGPAAAALLAGAVGAFVLGLMTTLAEVSERIKEGLAFNEPVGPLSGKVVVSVGVWIVAWIVLHVALRERAQLDRRVLTGAGVLLALGLLGTFPLFFQAFAA